MTDSICSKCGDKVPVPDSLIESSIDPIPGMVQVYRVDLICPHCSDSNLVHYTSDRLKKQGAKVGELIEEIKAGNQSKVPLLRQKSAKHKQEFNKFNRKVASITGERLPIPTLNQPVKINWSGNEQ